MHIVINCSTLNISEILDSYGYKIILICTDIITLTLLLFKRVILLRYNYFKYIICVLGMLQFRSFSLSIKSPEKEFRQRVCPNHDNETSDGHGYSREETASG